MPASELLDQIRAEIDSDHRLIRLMQTQLDEARTRIDQLAAEVRAEKARANGLEIERNLLLGQKAEVPSPPFRVTCTDPTKELGVPVSRLRPTEHWMHRAK